MSASSSVAYDQSRIPPRAGPSVVSCTAMNATSPVSGSSARSTPLVAGDVDGGEPHGRHPARRLHGGARTGSYASRGDPRACRRRVVTASGGLREELRGSPLPHERAPEPGGEWGLDPHPGARAHRRGVWGPGRRFLNRAGRRPGVVLRAARPGAPGGRPSRPSRRAARPSPRAPGARGRVPQAERRVLQRRGERRRGCRLRAACVRRRAAACAERLCRTRFAWSAFASRLASARSPATSARSSSARTVSAAPATERYASIASQLFAYAAEWDSRSITRMRTPAADATLRTNAAPAWSGVRTSRCGDRGPLSEPAPRNAPAEVGGAAARSGDDAAGRPVERAAFSVEHARLGEDVDRVADVPSTSSCVLVLRLERVSPVGSDLGVDPERPKDRERPSRDRRLGDVEVERQRPRPRRWTVPAVWKSAEISGEAVAAALRAERRELGARIGGERRRAQRSVPSSASSRRLSERPPGARSSRGRTARPPGRDDAVARGRRARAD